MTLSVSVSVTGAEDVKQLMKNGKNGVSEVQSEINTALQKLVSIWKEEMPVDTGHMRSSVFAVVKRPGEGVAFTRTYLKKPEGYAIFPELGTSPGHTRPGFTIRTVDRFAKTWEDDTVAKIDNALLR